MKAIWGVIKLVRPLNGLVAAASLLPALVLAERQITFDWQVGLTLFLLVSFGYIINDIFDLDGDREGQKNRPLARSEVSLSLAKTAAVVTALSAIAVGILAGVPLLLYCLALEVALIAYAAYLSTILGVSNIWVAAMCASVFYLPVFLATGELSENSCELLAYAALLSFLYHLGREIVKDIEDMRGDRILRRATLPLVLGGKLSRTISGIVLALMILVSYFVYWQVPNLEYLLTVTIGVNLPVALIFLIFYRRDAVGWAGIVSVGLKVIMIPALAALLLLGLP